VALLLAPGQQLRLALSEETAPTPCGHAGLDALRVGIPAARALPLLQAIARGDPAALTVEGLPGMSLNVHLLTPLP